MSIEPVRREIVVAATQERAFRVFGEGIDRWWPREHHIGASPMKRMILEPRVGGRWFSLCEDGSEADVGRVLAWDPPHRLLLAWQITAQWKFDPSFVTEAEVQFTALGPKQTRVSIEHRDMAKFGLAAEAMRAEFDAPGGWANALQLFARSAEAGEAP